MNEPTYKFTELRVENTMRVSLVELTLDSNQNLIVIGGRNGAGKSSVLASIEALVGGSDHLPKKIVKDGEEKSKISARLAGPGLDDLLIKRVSTADGGTSLVITNKDGVKYPTPQTMLDSIIGRLSFDPLEFVHQKPEQQRETIKDLLGLNFTEDDAKIEKLFTERTAVNREVKALQSRLVSSPEHEGVSGEEVSAAAVLADQESSAKINAGYTKQRNDLSKLVDEVESAKKRSAEWEEEIKRLEAELLKARNNLEGSQVARDNIYQKMTKAQAVVSELKDIDLAPFRQRVNDVETTNRKIRENRAKAELRTQFTAKQQEAEKLTSRIDSLEKGKRQKILDSKGKLPIPGLDLSEGRNVTFDGIPFEQVNTAAQLQISVAIGLALNKKLPILLIRRGSDLDPESLKVVAQLASQANAQVFLETSRTDAPVSVIMEDGHVKEAAVECGEA